MSDDVQSEGLPRDPADRWLWVSDYDLKCARDAFAAGNFLDVYFHCQQAVEKRLKAICTRLHAEPPPHTHRLMRLSQRCSLELSPAQEELMERLSTLYTEVRYPMSLSPGLQDPVLARQTLEDTQGMVEWLDRHPTS
jgi:HEPN domain-containing protein